MPTQQQLAARLNPTPVNINTPGEGAVWRDASNPNSNVYSWNNGKISALNLSMLGGGNGASAQAGMDALKSKYGIDYNSIPTGSYGTGDLLSLSHTTDYGSLDPASLQAALGRAAAPSTTTTVNNGGPQSVVPQGITPLGPEGAAKATPNLGPQGQFNTSTGTAGGAPLTPAQSQGPQNFVDQGQALQASAQGQQGTPSPYGNFSSTPTGSADQYLQNYLSTLMPNSQETALQGQLNDITSKQAGITASRDLGIQGVNEQPIATQFLTGQASAITNRAAVQSGALGAQAVPLQAQLALAQSKRQSAMDISKASMDYNIKQQELSKPVFGGYGSIGYQINPQTGRYEPIAGGTGDMSGISNAITNGLLDPSQISRYNVGAIGQTIQNDPNHDFVANKQNLQNYTTYTKDAFGNIVPVEHFPGSTAGASGGSSGPYQAGQLTALLKASGKNADDATLKSLWSQFGNGGTYTNDNAHNSKIYSAMGGSPSSGGSSGGSGGTTQFPAADAASLKQQQQYADSTQRAFNTANQNLQALIPYMQEAGVNSGSNIPLINSLQNKYKGQSDAGHIAAFKAALAGLRAEYAQVLSRGGEVTEGQRAQATSLIPDDLTPAQLQQVADRLNIEGTNAVKEANNQIQVIKDRVNGKPTSSSSSGATDINSLRTKYNY